MVWFGKLWQPLIKEWIEFFLSLDLWIIFNVAAMNWLKAVKKRLNKKNIEHACCMVGGW